MTLTFDVLGTPAPQGSKRHVGRGIMVESSAKVGPWREAVKAAALQVGPWVRLDSAPVSVWVTFRLPRPRGHYGSGRNSEQLKDSSPRLPAGKPDIDKLLRSTLDALSDVGVWRDDSQVAQVVARKVYADKQPPGARIQVGPMLDREGGSDLRTLGPAQQRLTGPPVPTTTVKVYL